MGVQRRIRAHKAPNLANKLKKRSKKSRKLNLMADPKNTELWDKFQSLKKNYKNINIGLKLNDEKEIIDNATPVEDTEATAGYMNIKMLKAHTLTSTPLQAVNELQGTLISQAYIEAQKTGKRKAVINRDEAMCVQTLMKKYNSNFAMWRKDIKLNMFQWTEKQCEFKLAEYKKRFKDDIIDWKKVN
jgi:Ribosome biogenesis protein Nop16